MARLKTICWIDDACRIVDQTLLPVELKYEDITSAEQMWDAIKILKVRGAPAIGIAAAFGLYLGIRGFVGTSVEEFMRYLDERAAYLASARPTAVNLFWALERVKRVAKSRSAGADVSSIKKIIFDEAILILEEDDRSCRAIGEFGFEELKNTKTLLTHCNAGGLATASYGTALAPVYVGQERGHIFNVYSDETRPLLQGSRITAFELKEAGIPVTTICDNMAAVLMAKGRIDAVIVGADRIAANGDAANKIGTYTVAVLAKHHGIPFYVAAPFSTFDLTLADGSGIPIEERDGREITHGFGRQTGCDGIGVFNPAFDVTPHELITGIITERGIARKPLTENISKLKLITH